MPKRATIGSQANFLGGLQGTLQPFQQKGKGIVSRISNMVYTIRGALKTVDGFKTIITWPQVGGQPTGAILAIGSSPALLANGGHLAIYLSGVATPTQIPLVEVA